jgi:hypothetical protein
VKKLRLLSAGAIAGLAGVMLMPLSASADTATTPSGSAQASALQVSVSPSALLSAVPAVGQLLDQTLGSVLGNPDLSLKVDAANANAVLNQKLTDLVSGHGDSTPVDIQFAPLQQELNTLQSTVNGLLGSLSGLGVLNLGGVLGSTGGSTGLVGQNGLLTGLLGSNSGVVQSLNQLLPQLNVLNGVLGGLTNGTISDALNGLGINLATTLDANYNEPGASNTPGGVETASVIQTPAGAPIQLNLAPFHARAVTAALAPSAGVAGPQASADNDTTSLAVLPTLQLPNLSALLGSGGSLSDLLGNNGLLASLLNTGNGLPVVGNLLSGIVGTNGASGGGLLAGLPLGNAVQGVLGGAGGSGLLGNVLGSNGLLAGLGGLTNNLPVVGGVLGGVTGSSSGSSVLGILGSNGSSGLLGSVTGLIGGLTNLQSLLSSNGLLGGLLNGTSLNLNQLVTTTGVTSNAIVQPLAGGSIESLASTKVGAVSVLPLGLPLVGSLGNILGSGSSGGLTGALNSIVSGLNLGSLANLGPLTNLLGGGSSGLAGISLLDISGITSSAQAVLGPNSGDPTGSSSLGEIKVLGIPVANLDTVANILVGSSKTITIPATGISLVISRGVPQIGYNTPTHKDVSVAALDIQLVNNGSGLLGSLLGGGSSSTSKPIVDVAVANSAADVSLTSTSAAPGTPGTGSTPGGSVPAVTPVQGPTPPSTGMFGTATLAVAGILAALAIALQAGPRLAARRISSER